MEPRKYGPFPYIPINRRPKITWPNGARVAVWVAPNFEAFALDEKMPVGKGQDSRRDVLVAARLWRAGRRVPGDGCLSQRGIRASVMLNSEVCDVYPEIIEDAMKLDWEFLGHNESNTRPLNDIPADDEKRVIHDSLARIERAIGKKPRGWLGSGVQETWNTLDYLADEGLRYVCDWVNDDQPYMIDAGGGRQLVSLPYSMEINDRPAFDRYYRTSDEFELMIRRQFDVLYREGADSGRVMSISVHPFIIGVPHRIWALESGLDYIAGHNDVWFATGAEIVDHYLASGVIF